VKEPQAKEIKTTFNRKISLFNNQKKGKKKGGGGGVTLEWGGWRRKGDFDSTDTFLKAKREEKRRKGVSLLTKEREGGGRRGFDSLIRPLGTGNQKRKKKKKRNQ